MSDVIVDAVFELPVPIWVMDEVLAATYPSGFGTLKFNVAMPTGDGPNGGPPAVISLHGVELTAPDVVWVHAYGAHIPDSYGPATALHRIVFTDVDGPTPEHLTWFTADAQLAEYVAPWFNAVRTWAEVVTGQDLDPNHRVYDAVAVGYGLTFLDRTHDGAHALQLTTPRVLPVPAREWGAILENVRLGKEPPLEELLSRDARASQRRGAERRAIIEAATALEIVMSRHVRGLIDELPEPQQRRLSNNPSLGAYIDIAEKSQWALAVEYEKLRWLSALATTLSTAAKHPTTGTPVQRSKSRSTSWVPTAGSGGPKSESLTEASSYLLIQQTTRGVRETRRSSRCTRYALDV